MSHLKIEQNTSSVEVISSTIIDKLYELAQSGTLDSSSNLKGNLQVTHAYEDAVTYLTTNYANLQINVTGGAYIRFADSVVLATLLSNLTPNDGVGITSSQPSSIPTIGYWFYGSSIISFSELSKFTNLTYLDGYTNNDAKGAFKNCTSLKSIVLPSSVTELRANAFSGCTKLQIINLNNVTIIRGYAFYNCTSLNINVSVLSNLRTIEDRAFPHAPLTGELNLPNLTGLIGGFAYTNITKVLDLGGATSMSGSDSYHEENATFSRCSLLTEINLPNTMTNLAGMSSCTSLTKCLFSNSVIRIDEHTFDSDPALTTLGDCSGIVSIGVSAFWGCTALTTLNLSSSCKTLYYQAFQNCSALKSIGDTSGVTIIYDTCFTNCSNLLSLSLSSACTTIRNYCFGGCTKLDTVGNLSGLTTTAGESHFRDSGITSIILGALTTVAKAMFYNCNKLVSVTGSQVFTSVGENSFYNCTSLLSIDLAAITTNTAFGSFKQCTALTTVYNFASASVGQSCFDTCGNLTTIDLSHTTTFNANSFSNCVKLANINNLSSAVTIGSGVFNHTALAIDINCPNLTGILGPNAFGYCANIINVTNLGTITSLGDTGMTWGPFNNCTSLQKVILPSTLTYIGSVAFKSCTSLVYIKCLATTPPTTQNNPFDGASSTFKIYVPDDSVTAYKAATNWSTYASRIFSLTQFAIDFPNG